jgi:hypothetical protein
MHIMDLGVTLYTLGAVFWEFAHTGPGTIANNVAALWAAICAEYAAQGVQERLAKLTRDMFEVEDGFAVLRQVKAAQSRRLVPVVLAVCRAADDGSEHNMVRLLALEALAVMYETVMVGDIFLSEEEFRRMATAADDFLLHYQWLSVYRVSRGDFAYNITYKFHAMWHMAQFAQFTNPKAIWAYSAEDFMGKVSASAGACLAGTPARLICTKLAANYRLALELRLSGVC